MKTQLLTIFSSAYAKRSIGRVIISQGQAGNADYRENAIMIDTIVINAGIIAILIGLLVPAVQKMRG